MLLYNGKAIFFGAANNKGHGNTVLYTLPASASQKGKWTTGPDIPLVDGEVMVCNDCPATLMPNGKVLFTASKFVANGWGAPIFFFEYDPAANEISQAPTPPNNATYPSSDPADAGVYWSRMMLLPNGQVLFSASSSNVQIYQPDGDHQDGWRPAIASVAPHGPSLSDYFLIQGTQLNGLSQANIYGDDCSSSTNYPLVRLTSTASGEVFYRRTHDFSTMGVSTGTSLQSCRFTPGDLPAGTYDLRVVANGIPSHAYSFTYVSRGKPQLADMTRVPDFQNLANGGGDKRMEQEKGVALNELRSRLASAHP
jgi:hypothetical protein